MAPNESKFAKQGEFRVVGCYKKTVVLYNTSRFCTEHHATYLQGLRALQAEKQLICSFPKCDKPPHGRITICQSHWEAEIELERPIMTLEEIDEESDRIVDNIVARIGLGKFKIGFTAQRKLRLSAYIKELKQSCILEPLIELKNGEKACLMEAAIIHKIMFHADLNVRDKLMNVTGGGKGTIIPKTRCWLYILTVEDDEKFTRGCDISSLPSYVFEEMLEVALDKITPLLTDRCFGIGASTNIDGRMLAHNKNKIYDYVAKKDFHKYALFKSGDKILTKEGESFVLKPIDVLKFEAYAHAVLRLTSKYQNLWCKCKTVIGGDGMSGLKLTRMTAYFRLSSSTGDDNSSSNIIEEDGEVKFVKELEENFSMSEIIAKSELVLKPERSKDYSCKYNCGDTFAFPSGKYRHERTCDKNPAKDTERFKCSYPDCNSTFSREDGLKNHVRSFHESNDKKSRQSKALMKMHEKKVAAGNVKRMKNEQVTKKKQPTISAAFNQSPSTSSSSNAKKRINNDSPTKQPQNSKKSKI